MRFSTMAGTLVFALFVGVTALTGGHPGTAQAEPITTEEALAERVLGDPNAPVEIIEYASMTCPHCAAFHNDTMGEIKKKYIDTGKAKLVMRDFPFDRLGAMAAMMARCANPDRYFQFIDFLFKQQASWSRSQDPVGALAKIGKLGGLSQADFDACMSNEELLSGMLASRVEAVETYKVNSTPTFFVNGEKITGNQPLEVFETAIEDQLD